MTQDDLASNGDGRADTTLVDAVGRQHIAVDFQLSSPRIVSLVPSITELLCDLGLATYLVGRTGFCVHPAAVVARIPKVGGTKDVNLEKIRALEPTHLIVNIDENEKPMVESLAQFIPHVIVTHPLIPSDNLALYRLLGGIFGAAMQAEVLCEAFEREMDALRAVPATPPRTLLYCIWKDPWMTVSRNTYIAAMLALIGWQHWQIENDCPADSAPRYPKFEWSSAMLEKVDEVLLSSEPYRFTEAHVIALEKQIGKPVRLVDGEMLSWYG
ncbi:MAG TPA: helical backbone metal receptor, partial [Burkholderiaceae bacterium]|nr:helical backbone metal receptor [Burkholderiaceae bacterium]